MALKLLVLCLALGAACDGKTKNKPTAAMGEKEAGKKNINIADNRDTLYRISGTEPFWSLLLARPEIIFTSMEGDTLIFPYSEPRQAAGRPENYVQVYELGEQQMLLLRKENSCPCFDGMSDIEYPYKATLVLKDRVLEGCGRSLIE